MAAPIRNYNEYDQQYVQPSAASLDALMRRFAVDVGGGALSFGAQTAAARPSWTSWLIAPPAEASPLPTRQLEREDRKLEGAPTASRGFYGQESVFGRLKQGQVTTNQMSDQDLAAEAEALGIAGIGVMPRQVLEQAVTGMRKERQAKNSVGVLGQVENMGFAAAGMAVGMLEMVQSTAENFGLAGAELQTPEARGWLSTIFNQERNRALLGKVKANLRLSATETQASAMDKAEALGEFVGPFVPQAALWSAIKTTGKVAGAAPVVGRSASWLFNGGLRGDVASGALANLAWNAQFDMPWLPSSRDIQDLTQPGSLEQLGMGALNTMNTRVGGMLLDAGLGALLGRITQRGPTALPDAAQPFVVEPTIPTGPPSLGPALQGELFSPSGQLLLNRGPIAQPSASSRLALPPGPAPIMDDALSWRPQSEAAVPTDVASRNIPGVRAETEPAGMPMGPRTAGLTAEDWATQYQTRTTEWPTSVPVPGVGQNNVPNWQNLPSARLARLRGTSLTQNDGSLIALVHEGPAFSGDFSVDASRITGLAGRGAYFRDRMDEAYAEFSQATGYAVRRQSDASAQYTRTAELLENTQEQITQLQAAMRGSKPAGPKWQVQADRLASLQSQADLFANKLNEMGTPSAASHPVFAVVKNPFYFDAPITREQAEQIFDVIATNPQFENLVPSLNQMRPKLDTMFQPNSKPMANQFYGMLSEMWQTMPDGSAVSLRETGDANRVLQAAGYDAIHYVGGVRAGAPTGMYYNAWNLLDPENQTIRVFSPPEMDSGAAAMAAQQMSKQASLLESSVVEQLATETAMPVDSDIIAAGITKNPFGVQVVRGIRDPAPTMQKLALGDVGVDGVKPNSYRLIAKDLVPGGAKTFDLMVSTGKPITDQMVSDYTQYGVFEGMHGITGKHSRPVEAVKIFTGDGVIQVNGKASKKGQVYVQTRDLDKPTVAKTRGIVSRVYTSRLETFMETRAGGSVSMAQDPSLAQLTGEYMEYAKSRLGTDTEGLLSMDSMAKLSTIFDEFSAARAIPPAARSVVGGMVEQEMLGVARGLMGTELGGINQSIREALDDLPDEFSDTLQQLATRRGLRATRTDAGGWQLDGPRATRWQFSSEEAASKFVAGYTADTPDLSPSGPVFPEIADGYEPEVNIRMEPTLDEQNAAAVRSYQLMQKQFGQQAGGGNAPPPPPQQPPVGPPGPPPQGPPAGATGPTQPPGGRGPAPLGQLQQLAQNVSRIRHDLDNFVWQNVMPSRAFFDQMDQVLFENGATSLKPGQDMFNVRLSMSKFYNDSADLLGAITQDMNQFRSKFVRSGKVWEAMTYPAQGVPASQTTAAKPPRDIWMRQQGFSAREAATANQMSQMLDAIHGPGNAQWPMLKLYVKAVEQNMAQGLADPYALPQALQNQLAPIKPFMDHAKKRALRLEVPDAGMIMNEYVRSHFWARDVEPQWQAVQKQWRQVGAWQDFRGERPLAPVAEYVLGWMNGVEHGFLPQSDPLLNGVQWTLEKFGIPLTKSETMNMIGGTMSSAYRALLGWNPYAVMRDSTQPLMAIPWTGTSHLKDAYLAIAGAKGKQAQAAMWKNALDNGWTEKGIPPLLSANVEQSAINTAVPTGNPQFSPLQEKTRAMAQQVGDFLRDMTPPALRSIEGTRLDPLWAYTQQGVVARVVVGNAAAARFDELVAQPLTVQQLSRQLGLDGFSQAQKRHVSELLQAGQTKEARNVFANTVADMTMNRYGVKEGAVGNHRVLGRVGTQLGGHSSHQLSMFYNLAKGGVGNPTLYKMVGTVGAMTGAYVFLERQTGWQFTKYNPLNWAQSPQLGGPLIKPGVRALNAAQAAMGEGISAATGGDSQEYRTQQIEEFLRNAPRDIGKLAGTPAAGFRLLTGLGGAMAENAESVGRFLTTGDRRAQNQYEMQQSSQRLYDYLNGGYRDAKGGGAQ